MIAGSTCRGTRWPTGPPRAARSSPRPSPTSGWCCRPAPTRCAPTTPTTASGPTPPTPTSPATRPPTPSWSSRTASRCSTPGPAPSATPTSSSATGSTASCGPGAARRRRRSPTPSASRSATSRTCRRSTTTARPATSPPTRTSPASPTSCASSRTSGRSRELQEACDITTLGFEDSVREWDRVREFGERWIEGTFFRRARAMGNDIGYDSICAGGSHATTLHWIDNTGAIEPGKLVLLDMGVEGHNLYTADVTRTLPVDGRFTPLQRELYDLVHAGAAGRHRRRPARCPVPRRPQRRDEGPRPRPRGLGLLPVSAEEALDPESKVYARWTLHGTCAHARHGRPRLRSLVGRHLPQGRPRRGHGAHRRAGPLLPGGRPARPGGAARHRHPHRGRHPRHRRRQPEPLGLAPPHLGRRRGVDGLRIVADPARRSLGSSTGAALPPLRRLPLPLLHPARDPARPPALRQGGARALAGRLAGVAADRRRGRHGVPQQGQDGGRRHRRRADAGDPRPRPRRGRPARLRPALRRPDDGPRPHRPAGSATPAWCRTTSRRSAASSSTCC